MAPVTSLGQLLKRSRAASLALRCAVARHVVGHQNVPDRLHARESRLSSRRLRRSCSRRRRPTNVARMLSRHGLGVVVDIEACAASSHFYQSWAGPTVRSVCRPSRRVARERRCSCGQRAILERVLPVRSGRGSRGRTAGAERTTSCGLALPGAALLDESCTRDAVLGNVTMMMSLLFGRLNCRWALSLTRTRARA